MRAACQLIEAGELRSCLASLQAILSPKKTVASIRSLAMPGNAKILESYNQLVHWRSVCRLCSGNTS